MTVAATAVTTIEHAHRVLGLTYIELARALAADESTLHRWRSGYTVPSPVFETRLAGLAELLAALERVFPDWNAATAWLQAPLGEIGGREPRALLLQGRCDVILGILSVLAFAHPSHSEPGGYHPPKLELLQAAGSTRTRHLR